MRGSPMRGLSLVELLIGAAIGLFLVSSAIGVVNAQLRETRAVLAETKLLHELRGAADRVVRDLRRAGYWGDAAAGVWQAEQPDRAPRANPYGGVAPAAAAASAIAFAYSRDAAENHAVDGNESFGYRLRSGNLEALLGSGGWQTLTDPATIVVTAFSVTPRSATHATACARPCPEDDDACPPRVEVRTLAVRIDARSAIDASVVRSYESTARMRNDAVVGRCAD